MTHDSQTTLDVTGAVEALLFVSGKAMTRTALAKALTVDEEVIDQAIVALGTTLANRQSGLRILEHGSQVQLVTAPEVAPRVNDFLREELEGKLSRAALETLAIVAYRGPIGKPEVDYVRGVNSSVMLRTLLIRGLVERTRSEKDSRTFMYDVSSDLMRHLGVTKREALPEFEAFHTHATVSKLLEQSASVADHATAIESAQ